MFCAPDYRRGGNYLAGRPAQCRRADHQCVAGQATQSIAAPPCRSDVKPACRCWRCPKLNLSTWLGLSNLFVHRRPRDFRISNISGTGAAGIVPASPGTGNTYIYSAQAIGNSLLSESDLGVASASYIDARSYKGQSLAYTQVETFRQRWRLDVSLQLYNQKNNLDVHQTRITPSLKLSYHLSDSVSLDGEGGIEDTRVSRQTTDEKIRRKYIYLGYRWYFR